MRLSRHKIRILILLLLFSGILWFALRHRIAKRPVVKGEALSHVIIFAASSMEARTVEGLMNPAQRGIDSSGPVTGRIGVNEVSLYITGIGPKKAEASAGAVLISGDALQSGSTSMNRRPDAVLVIGLCGSLTASIDEGGVVLYTNCLLAGNNESRQSCTAELNDRVYSLLNSKGLPCKKVAGITSPRVATSKTEKLSLATSFAEVVDMESYPIIASATQVQIPVAVIRVVSDSLDREMPDFNRALNADGEVDSLKVSRIFLGSPITTLKLLLTSRNSTQRLKEALEFILPAGIFCSAGS